MNPGQTTLPVASMICFAVVVPMRPTAVDAIAGNADIGVKPRQPGAIDDAAVADQDVKHGSEVLG